MKKKLFASVFFVFTAGFFYHQYRWIGPYDAILRREPISSTQVLQKLKRWRYHTDVWFEIVPDALTTVFKRLGIGGWTETGHRSCVEGCVYWTQKWTDGFYSADLELERFSLDEAEAIVLPEPRFIDVESWGRVRSALESAGRLPAEGHRLRICGLLRVDRPYDVLTLHPDRPEDYEDLGHCRTLSKDPREAFQVLEQTDCNAFGQKSLFAQIALLDSLAEAHDGKKVSRLIEKVLPCADPKVLQSLAGDPDVYERLVAKEPGIQSRLPAMTEKNRKREGSPVKNTIADLLKHWFNRSDPS